MGARLRVFITREQDKTLFEPKNKGFAAKSQRYSRGN